MYPAKYLDGGMARTGKSEVEKRVVGGGVRKFEFIVYILTAYQVDL